MKEAFFYAGTADAAVQCSLCQHRCRIADGKRGVCGVRENRGGVLYSLVYGRLVAEHVDPIEKKPLYHFLPGSRSYSIATPGCNFRCPWCQNWQISEAHGIRDFARIPAVPPERIAERAVETRCRSVSYTYTEPTIFMEYALDVARLSKQSGLKNVFVTNGYESPEAVQAMTGLIDAANVDLKSFSAERYRRDCGARLDLVLETIRNLYAAGIHLEITTLIVPDQNDSPGELRQIAGFVAGLSLDMPWHVSRFHPQYKVTDRGPTPAATMQRAVAAGRAAGLRYVYAGNISLADAHDTVCPQCGETVIRRGGFGAADCRLNGTRCPRCASELPIIAE